MPALLHLRLVLDEQHRDAVIAFLRDHEGTANVAMLEGAMVDSRADLVLVDVAREAANEVIEALQAIGVTQIGTISIDHAALTLGEPADRAHDAAPGDADETVLWPEVDALIETSAKPTIDFLAYFVVAALIAVAGVLSDSPVLIVGAMVVGPEYPPIAAMSYGIARNRPPLLARAMRTFVIGTLAGIGAATALTLALRALGAIPEAYRGTRPLTSFISRPDLLSAIVASAAAVAGVLALTHERASTLVGVLVSVTTIPAIAAAGVSIALADWGDLRGSAAQLGINVACLVVVGALTIVVLRRTTPGRRHR